ncbi:sensor histidine kinase [Amycolatopsis anabasis]|uniref:sensor histidine kinase n=1 Tax=Amycolatopsis anabasis TaxID=1840409 RepID=UPI00131D0963|nr:histidine kinase [Amycolatopsis anabasis]
MVRLLTALWRRPVEFVRDTVDRARTASLRGIRAEVVLIVVCVAIDAAGAGLVDERPGWQIIGLAVLYIVLLLLRRALPAVALVLGVPLLYTWDLSLATGLVLVYWAGYRIIPWQRAAAAILLAMGLIVVLAIEDQAPFLDETAGLDLLLLVALGVVLPFLIGLYAAQRRQLAQALAWQDRQIRRERSLLATQARLRERNRIAQDMHDGLGHRLSLISLLTGVVEQHRNLPAELRGTVGTLHTTAHNAIDELRDTVGALAPDNDPADRPGAHTAEGIPALVDAARAAGTDVGYHHLDPPPELTAAASHAAYRVVQEGLTNAHKHAAGASITVSVTYEPDAMLVEVRNGPPASPTGQTTPGTKLGLIGLAERVRLTGGMLHSGGTPDGGFRIAAMLPYDPNQSSSTADEPDAGQDAPETTRRPRVHAGTGFLIAAAACFLGVLALFGWLAANEDFNALPRSVYDSVSVGDSEATVTEVLPEPTEPMITDLRIGAPPEPPNSTCRYYLSDEERRTTMEVFVFRFCFADNTLIEKQTYTQP